MNTNGGVVLLPRGIYRVRRPLSPLTCGGCGFVGTGAGMRYTTHNDGPGGGPHGSVIRLDAPEGDTVTIARSANNVMLRDIGFWPVAFRIDGVEVADHGQNTILENLSFAYGHGAVAFRGGANGSSAHRLRAFSMFGPAVFSFQGASPDIADWVQGVVVSDIVYYSPWPVSDPVSRTTTARWSSGQAYARGAVTSANGYIWQAVREGRSADSGQGPQPPRFGFAGAPTTTEVSDGSVYWRPVEHAQSAGLLVDSNTVDLVIARAQILSMSVGLLVRNSLGSGIVPQYIKLVDSLVDHTVGDAVRFEAGYQNTLRDTDLHNAALGRGLVVETGYVGGLRVSGGHVWNNAFEGIALSALRDAQIAIYGAAITGNGVARRDVYSGIAIAPGATGISLIGNHIGRDAAGGGTQRFAIEIGKGNHDLVINGNVMIGNASGTIGN